ncbi:MAG: BspA family leucine-rich repeat surface protein [Defluviitaleaceae bacterium]|nr:BspA family leucine-rich repeat surface protein [Defluviitaleaceae bacterium]
MAKHSRQILRLRNQRPLALFLAVVLFLSTVNIPVLAEEELFFTEEVEEILLSYETEEIICDISSNEDEYPLEQEEYEAEEPEEEPEVQIFSEENTGTLGTGGAPWALNAETGIVTISGGTTSTNISTDAVITNHWMPDAAMREQVTEIVFTAAVTSGVNLNAFFRGFPNLEVIRGMSHFDTSAAITMSFMFDGAASIRSLDLTHLNTRTVTGMENMFRGMTLLREVTFGQDFVAQGTTSLPAPNPTAQNWRSFSFEGTQTNAQLWTRMASSTRTAAETWMWGNNFLEKEYGYLGIGGAPWTFNAGTGTVTISAGVTNTNNATSATGVHWMPDQTMRGLVRRIEFTEAVTAGTNLANFFRFFPNLETISGLNNFNVSAATTMASMFQDANSLTSLDLSSWSTASIAAPAANMASMFAGTTALRSITFGANFRPGTSHANSIPNVDVSHGGPVGSPAQGTWQLTGSAASPVTSADLWLHLRTERTATETWTWSERTVTGTLGEGGAPWSFDENTGVVTISAGAINMVNTVVAGTHWMISPAMRSQVRYINIAEEVTAGANLTAFFMHFPNLQQIRNLNNLNTAVTTNMTSLFNGLSQLRELNLSGMNTLNAATMDNMFTGTTNLRRITFGTNFETTGGNSILAVTAPNGTVWRNEATLAVLESSQLWSRFITTQAAAETWSWASEVNRGTLGAGGAQWQFNPETGVVTILGGTTNTVNAASEAAATNMGHWMPASSMRSRVTEIVFTVNVAAGENLSNFFRFFPNLKEINGLNYLNTAATTNMSNMFNGLTLITQLNFSNWNTRNVTDMTGMFSGVNALSRITFGYDFRSVGSSSLSTAAPGGNWISPQVHLAQQASGTLWTRLGTAAQTIPRASVETWIWSSIVFAEPNGTMGPGGAPWHFVYDGDNRTDIVQIGAGITNTANTSGTTGWHWMPGADRRATVKTIRFTAPVIAGTNLEAFFMHFPNLETIENIHHLNLENTETIQNMFAGVSTAVSNNITQLDLSSWDTSNITNMQNVFSNLPNLTTLNIAGWNVENVTNMQGMFQNATGIQQLNFSGWNTENVTNMTSMFASTNALSRITFGSDFRAVSTSSLPTPPAAFGSNWISAEAAIGVQQSWQLWTRLGTVRDMTETWMWSGLLLEQNEGALGVGGAPWTFVYNDEDETGIVTISGGVTNTFNSATASAATNAEHWMPSVAMRAQVTEIVFTANVYANENLVAFFRHFPNLETISGISFLITDDAENMQNMFDGANSLTSLNLSSWNTENVTNMASMFAGTHSLTQLILPANFVTSGVTNLQSMFHGARGLETLNLSGWNTSGVTDMANIFNDMQSLRTLNLTNWDTRQIVGTVGTNMQSMFANANALRQITFGQNFRTISGWNSIPNPPADFGGNWLSPNVAIAPQTSNNLWARLAAETPTPPRAGTETWMWSDLLLGVEEGTLGIGGATWTLNDDTVTINGGVTNTANAVSPATTTLHWMPDSNMRNSVTSIVFTAPVTAGENLSAFFMHFPNLQTITGLNHLDVSAAANMSNMFNNAGSLSALNLSSWNTENVTNMTDMFSGTSTMQSLTIGPDFIASTSAANSLFTPNPAISSGLWRLAGTNNVLTPAELWTRIQNPRNNTETWEWLNVPDAGTLGAGGALWRLNRESGVVTVYGGVTNTTGSQWIPANLRSYVKEIEFIAPVTAGANLSNFFNSLENIEAINGLHNLNVSATTNMSNMFNGASNLKSLDLSGWNTANVTNMSWMFSGTTTMHSITFGADFLATGSNSLLPPPAESSGLWRLAGTNFVRTSAELWSHLSTVRESAETWEWFGMPNAGALGFGGAIWQLNRETGVVTVQGGITNTTNDAWGSTHWMPSTLRADVREIRFTAPVTAGEDLANFFRFFTNLETINGLNHLNVSTVTDMSNMFSGLNRITTLDLSGWNTASVASMAGMFSSTTALSRITFGPNFVAAGTNSLPGVTTVNGGDWFNVQLSERMTSFNLWTHLQTPRASTQEWLWSGLVLGRDYGTLGDGGASWTFEDGIVTIEGGITNTNNVTNNFNTTLQHWLINPALREQVTRIEFIAPVTAGQNLTAFFAGFPNLEEITGIHHLDVSAATNMSHMFSGANSLTELNLTGWNTENATNMTGMFTNTIALRQITFGADFVSVGDNSIPNVLPVNGGVWRHVFDNSFYTYTSANLWNSHLRESRDTVQVWLWGSLVNINAQEKGTLGADGAPWEFFPSVGLVVIGGGVTNTNNALWPSETSSHWMPDFAMRNRVTQIIFTEPVEAGTNLRALFAHFPNVVLINGLSLLDVSDATDMSGMFRGASSLEILDISNWDTRSVTNMTNMFADARNLNRVIFGPNFVSVGENSLRPENFWRNVINEDIISTTELWTVNLRQTTRTAAEIWAWFGTHLPDLHRGTLGYGGAPWTFNPDTGIVTIEGGITNTNGEQWVPNAFVRGQVNEIAFTAPVTAGTNVSALFMHFPNLTTISALYLMDTSAVTNMSSMFQNASGITSLDLSSWNTSNVQSMANMFTGTNNLSAIQFGTEFTAIGANSIPAVPAVQGGVWLNNDAQHSTDATLLTSAQLWAHLGTGGGDLWTWRGATSGTLGMGGAPWFFRDGVVTIEGGISNTNGAFWIPSFEVRDAVVTINFTSSIAVTANASNLFSSLPNLTEINNLDLLDVSTVENMNNLFSGANSLVSLDLSCWDTSNVTSMLNMFSGTTALESITFGEDFVTIGSNSLPMVTLANGGMWRSNDSDDAFTSANLWVHMSTPRDEAQTWTWCINLPRTLGRGGAEWSLNEAGGGNPAGSIVTIRAGITNTNNAISGINTTRHWMPNPSMRAGVTRIVFTEPVEAGTNLRAFFAHFPNLQFIDGLHYLDTSKTEDMTRMFYGVSRLTLLDVSDWNTSNVLLMTQMFEDATGLTALVLSNWDTSRVVDMSFMFAGLRNMRMITFGQNFVTVGGNSLPEVAPQWNGLWRNTVTDQTLTAAAIWESLRTARTTDLHFAWRGLSLHGTLGAGGAPWVLEPGEGIVTIEGGITNTQNTNTSRTDMHWMPDADMRSMVRQIIFTEPVTAGTNLDAFFVQFPNLAVIRGLEYLNIEGTETMNYMFVGLSNLTYLDLHAWDTTNIKEMTGMFLGTNSLRGIIFGPNFVTHGENGLSSVPLGQGVWRHLDAEDNFRTPVFNSPGLWEHLNETRSNTQTWVWTGPNTGMLGSAFWFLAEDTGILTVGEGEVFTINGTHWMSNSSLVREQVTRIVFIGPVTAGENISDMFSGFLNLYQIVGLHHIDTENAVDMSRMFMNSPSLTSLDLSSWNTENVTDMSQMFRNTVWDVPSSLTTLNLNGWNTENVITMSQMFTDAINLRRITFGEKFIPVGSNSLPAVPWGWDNVWRSLDVDDVYTSFNLWNALSVPRTGSQTWVWNALLLSTGTLGTGTATWSLPARVEGQNYTELVIGPGTSGTTNSLVLPMIGGDTLQDHWMPLAGMRWRVQSIRITGPIAADENLRAFFAHFPNLEKIEGLHLLNTSIAEDMTRMFWGSSNLHELDLSGRITTHVKYMTQMFAGLSSLTELDLTGWSTSSVENMDFIFAGTSALHTITFGNGFTVIGENSLVGIPPWEGTWHHDDEDLESEELWEHLRNLRTAPETWKWISRFAAEPKRGDVNGDGFITMADVTLIMRYVVGHNVTINTWAADVNGDGVITTADATLLARYLAGHNVTLAE